MFRKWEINVKLEHHDWAKFNPRVRGLFSAFISMMALQTGLPHIHIRTHADCTTHHQMCKDSWWHDIFTEHFRLLSMNWGENRKVESTFHLFSEYIILILLNWSKLGKEQRRREKEKKRNGAEHEQRTVRTERETEIAPEWWLGIRGLTNYTKVLLKAMLWIPKLSLCISSHLLKHTHTWQKYFPQI